MNYLFRGKRTDKERWAEGSLITHNGSAYIVEPHPMVFDSAIKVKVDPDSIGMWTGLTDKNDKRIFGALPDSKGGDVVRTLIRNNELAGRFKVKPEQCYQNGSVVYNPRQCKFEVRFPDNESRVVAVEFGWHSEEFEVIGNAFDNPELLEE